MCRRNDDRAFDAQTFAALDFESKPAEQENTHRSPHSSKKDFAERAIGGKESPHGPRS
jgi:hypothetical protein